MSIKRLALIAHDSKKNELVEWVSENQDKMTQWQLFATGTTGKLIEEKTKLTIKKLKSGPLGGDQQIGALIAEDKVDMLVFFWDPLSSQPHDPDVKALLRLAVVWNIPMACNRVTADFLFSSSLLFSDYKRATPNFDKHENRNL